MSFFSIALNCGFFFTVAESFDTGRINSCAHHHFLCGKSAEEVFKEEDEPAVKEEKPVEIKEETPAEVTAEETDETEDAE